MPSREGGLVGAPRCSKPDHQRVGGQLVADIDDQAELGGAHGGRGAGLH